MLDIHDIRPGDVLREVSTGSRQYVVAVGDKLYADFNPRGEDGERLFGGYCDALVSLELCPLDRWEVCDHYGDGSVGDARAWRERYLRDREPTQEHLADPMWRREYRYNG